jgi:hypothetical protein
MTPLLIGVKMNAFFTDSVQAMMHISLFTIFTLNVLRKEKENI